MQQATILKPKDPVENGSLRTGNWALQESGRGRLMLMEAGLMPLEIMESIYLIYHMEPCIILSRLLSVLMHFLKQRKSWRPPVMRNIP